MKINEDEVKNVKFKNAFPCQRHILRFVEHYKWTMQMRTSPFISSTDAAILTEVTFVDRVRPRPALGRMPWDERPKAFRFWGGLRGRIRGVFISEHVGSSLVAVSPAIALDCSQKSGHIDAEWKAQKWTVLHEVNGASSPEPSNSFPLGGCGWF